jgi:WD40 repeat protein
VAPVARQAIMDSQSASAATYMLALPYLSNQSGQNAQTLQAAALIQGQTDLAKSVLPWADWGPWVPLGGVSRASKVAMGAFLSHRATTTALAILPRPHEQGDLVVSCSLDGTARVWDPFEPGAPELACFEGHEGPVRAVATLSWPDRPDPVIVTTGDDGSARVWDPHDLKVSELARYDGHTDWVGSVATLSTTGGNLIVTTSGDGTAILRSADTATGDVRLCYDRHRGRVRDATFIDWTGGGPTVATSSDDGTVHLWAINGREATTLAVFDGSAAGITSTIQARRGQDSTFASACHDGIVYVWHPSIWGKSDAEDRGEGLHTGRVRASALVGIEDSGDLLLVTGSNDCTARVWRAGVGGISPLDSFEEHTDWVRDLTTVEWPGLSHPAVASASGDGRVLIWDPLAPKRVLATYAAHTAPVRSVRAVTAPWLMVPHLLTASADGSARIWNPYGQPAPDLAVLPHGQIVRSALQVDCDDGIAIATVSETQVGLWRIAQDGGLDCHTTSVSRSDLRDIATLQIGTTHLIAAVGNDGIVHLLDPGDDLRQVATGIGHRDWIWGVATVSTADGPQLVTVSADGTMRMWKYADAQLIETARVNIVSAGLSVRVFGDKIVVTTSRGFLVFGLAQNESLDG